MTDAVAGSIGGVITGDPMHAFPLSRDERRTLSLRLTLGLATAGLLLLSLAVSALAPLQSDVASLLVAAAALLVAGPTLRAGWHSLRHPDLHGLTDQLVALATLAAWASGALLTAALLPLLMTVGHVLEERSLPGAGEAMQALTRLTNTSARRLGPAGPEQVPAASLRPGDRIELRPGDRIPADARVLSGRASIDSAALTGESAVADAGPGMVVLGGALNLDGMLQAEILRAAGDSTIGQVIALLQAAEEAKPPISRLLERHAGQYLALVLLAAAATWFATGSAASLLSVLVAACPCALVLAAPATAVAGIAVAARHGILVRGAAFLERLGELDCAMFDKTGTLTTGMLRLADIRPMPGVEAAALAALAARLGAGSHHPVSRALAGLDRPADPSDQRREQPGLGITGTLDGRPAALGQTALFETLGIAVPALPPHPGPLAGVSQDDRFLGWLLLEDTLRPEAAEALQMLRRLGLEQQMLLTGDRPDVAERIAAAVGIEFVQAGMLPQDKLASVRRVTASGGRPLVVGDGLNDSLALRAGAVGVAMATSGIDVAIASADIVLIGSDLRHLPLAIELSRRCRRSIHVNVALGLGWTVAIVLGTASGLFGASGALVAAVLHNVGSILVIANAGRLLRFRSATSGPCPGPSGPVQHVHERA